MSAIRKPEKLLNALMTEFSVREKLKLEDVNIEASLCQERPDIDRSDTFLLTGLNLLNANFEFDDNKLVAAHAKRYQQNIPFVKIKFERTGEKTEASSNNTTKRTRKNVYRCPVYETFNRYYVLHAGNDILTDQIKTCRSYLTGRSSLSFYLKLHCDCDPDILAKHGAALTSQI